MPISNLHRRKKSKNLALLLVLLGLMALFYTLTLLKMGGA